MQQAANENLLDAVASAASIIVQAWRDRLETARFGYERRFTTLLSNVARVDSPLANSMRDLGTHNDSTVMKLVSDVVLGNLIDANRFEVILRSNGPLQPIGKSVIESIANPISKVFQECFEFSARNVMRNNIPDGDILEAVVRLHWRLVCPEVRAWMLATLVARTWDPRLYLRFTAMLGESEPYPTMKYLRTIYGMNLETASRLVKESRLFDETTR